MSFCPKIDGCPFFHEKLANMPIVADSLKDSYCRDDYTECARFIVSEKLGKACVPIDLYPNHNNRAQRILDKA